MGFFLCVYEFFGFFACEIVFRDCFFLYCESVFCVVFGCECGFRVGCCDECSSWFEELVDFGDDLMALFPRCYLGVE